ncbi:HTH-type transcriptional regulator AcrR [Pseudodesulfovibrio hydrargyri]|uniref:HTH-type transcriptional regulator AcrR n=1 Tax=Pseudodesulfovibrio hydrargyri TaxID=2125990 RepID=A0A1J5N7R2_9BACT|nr:TetR/AcrR family transcriptional regulator [Pseudodesulfovibrio hydrargyri]OIQ49335.1 HTH-type transcriptional regulator AcrR [Pseudodesulfovibrio hydrargyri]
MPTAKEKNVQAQPSGQYPRNAAETRQRILAAARTLFSQDIYKNVGTRDIAAAAGVNLTLINRYFGSKKQLFSEVILSMKNFKLASDPKQLEREVLADLLAEEDNPRKQKLRLLLLGAMDSEVSDVVTEFFRRRKGRVLGTREDGHETRAFLQLASLVGISLTFFLLPEEDRARLDKDFILDHFVKSLEEG